MKIKIIIDKLITTPILDVLLTRERELPMLADRLINREIDVIKTAIVRELIPMGYRNWEL